MFKYNTHIHRATNFTLYELIFYGKPYIPKSITYAAELKYTYDDYYSSLKFKLNKAHEIERESLLESKETSKLFNDRNVRKIAYEVGDLEYILSKISNQG